MDLPPSATQGVLHHVPPLSTFEPSSPSNTSPQHTHQPPPNLLLWIGGLFDTYHTVQYPFTLAQRLPASWSLATTNLSSAGTGWGIASLGQDVAEISKLVSYFRNEGKRGGKVVIMGHSTGCQDCLHYACSAVTTTTTTTTPDSDHGLPDADGKKAQRQKVDAIILQAPVSDREAIAMDGDASKIGAANELARHWLQTDRGEDCLPASLTATMFGNCPITARRWLSLTSPDKNGEDDYFSSDLPEARLRQSFGNVEVPVLVLMGEADEYVPGSVDKSAVVGRWIDILREKGTRVGEDSEKLLGGATHNLNGVGDDVVDELCNRVIKFLKSVEDE